MISQEILTVYIAMPVVLKDSNKKIFTFTDRDVSGVILAGGRSSRYGENKGFARLNGITLIERVINALQPLFKEIVLITNTPYEYEHLGLAMHEDIIKGLGPLGGIHTALSKINSEAGFFVACDMPALNRDLIHYMVEVSGNFDVVIPCIAGKMETLHAIYSKTCLKPVKRLIDSGQRQIFRFFHEVSVRCVEKEEILRFDPELISFSNINRPQELSKYEKLLREVN